MNESNRYKSVSAVEKKINKIWWSIHSICEQLDSSNKVPLDQIKRFDSILRPCLRLRIENLSFHFFFRTFCKKKKELGLNFSLQMLNLLLGGVKSVQIAEL